MRTCNHCGAGLDASRADATYCAPRCRVAAWRARRADDVHTLLMRQAEITRARLSAVIADDPTAVAEADRLLDAIDHRAVELFGPRN